MWRGWLLTYDIVSGNSSWVNGCRIYQAKAKKNSEHQDDTSALPAKRMKVTGGPQAIT